MKKLAFLGGAAGLGLIALLHAPITQAADHLDALALATNKMADINDVYAWMTDNGSKVALAMTVSPFDDGQQSFGPSVQYAFHMRHFAPLSAAGFPSDATVVANAEESKVICTFTSDTAGKCWVIDHAGKTVDYVEGDFSAAAGKASVGGRVRVFAGRRSDPFFFNFAGFVTAQKKLETACGGTCPGNLAAISDAAGCPSMAPLTVVGPIAADLSEQQNGQATPDPGSVLPPGCPATNKDCFADKNVMAIVVEFDKALIAVDEKPILGVYGSTHAAQ